MSIRWSLVPRRISSQIALIIVAGLVIIHAIVIAIFFVNRPDDRRPPDSPREIATLARLVDATPAGERARLIADLNRAFAALDLSLADTAPASTRWLERDAPLPGLPPRPPFAGGLQVGDIDGPGGAHRIAVRLHDGQVLTAQLGVPPPRPFGPETVTLVTFLAITAVLALWAARALTAPLSAFAKAAEAFEPDGEIAALPERGPTEIKTVAKALNQMRERIKRLVDDRTRMLAAMGHDLRTPITRLRLRSEFIDDAALRVQMLRDLDQMTAMVESVLLFLRNERAPRPRTAIDIAADLQTIRDHFADIGHEVRYEGCDHASIDAHPDELQRAVSNLVDNAVRYGGRAVVRLDITASQAIISVEDDGPGIPGEAQKAAMLEPFVRGDAARQMDDNTGFGLGLSIAAAVVRAHGGSLRLLDREPRGLTVRIELPR